MKAGFLILFLCSSLAGFTQLKQSEKIKIPVGKVVKAVTVMNIIPDDLGKCKVTSYHFTANLGNNVKSIDVKNGDVTETIKTIVKELKAGDKFMVENVKYDCSEDYKKSYIFIIQ